MNHCFEHRPIPPKDLPRTGLSRPYPGLACIRQLGGEIYVNCVFADATSQRVGYVFVKIEITLSALNAPIVQLLHQRRIDADSTDQ